MIYFFSNIKKVTINTLVREWLLLSLIQIQFSKHIIIIINTIIT